MSAVKAAEEAARRERLEAEKLADEVVRLEITPDGAAIVFESGGLVICARSWRDVLKNSGAIREVIARLIRALRREALPAAPAALPTPEQVAEEFLQHWMDPGDTMSLRTLLADTIRADRARRVVGIDPERLREALENQGLTTHQRWGVALRLLAEHDARAGGAS